MKIQKLLKIINPYCSEIKFSGKHYRAIIKGKGVITISHTPSDNNYHKMVYLDFKRIGIKIPELKNQ